jgi:hypothetical protein
MEYPVSCGKMIVNDDFGKQGMITAYRSRCLDELRKAMKSPIPDSLLLHSHSILVLHKIHIS